MATPSALVETSILDALENEGGLDTVPEEDEDSITASLLKKVSTVKSGEQEDASIASVASTTAESASAQSSGTRLVSADEEIKILGEVVGGYRLHGRNEGEGDVATSALRPFCTIRFGGSLVHRTDKVEDGAGENPVWTLSTKSLFLWEATPRELAQHDLQVSVWYKERDPLNITTLETVMLGKFQMRATKILSKHCDEERLEMELVDRDGAKTGATLTMRFRLATLSDQEFMNRLYRTPPEELPHEMCAGLTATKSIEEAEAEYNKSPWDGRPLASLTTEIDEAQMAGTGFFNALSSAFTMKTYMDRDSSELKVLVKPGPDPNRPTETTYLSQKEIRRQTALPSQEWIEAGSGTLGKLYLEILSCKDLPNVDVGEAVGNVTDCFIAAVFEDVMVQTPVIDDELSPCWLPWTQRAFCINIMHPASMLYLGAFDFDLGLSDHDPLGRVAVNLSNLKRNMDYTLTYNLYPSSNVTDRTSAGSITIRVRMEYENEKAALLAALGPRPKFHVNVSKEKSLKVMNYTCFGEFGDQFEQSFDLTVMRSYINEIVSYKNALLYCIGDTFRSLVFWRGQVQVCDVMLPIHSLLFFCGLTTLIEKPYLTPPFFLLSVAWVMLATLTQRRQHPSPWNDVPSFAEFLEVLHQGKSSASVLKIEPNQKLEEVEAYEKAWKDRVEKDLNDAAERWEREQEIMKIGDESIHTKTDYMIPLDLLERLTRYQGIIGRYCRHARFIKMIATWEEGMVSFWFTACFLAAGFAALLLPWSFILTWTSRVVVWGLLGPHMMIVDIVLRDRQQDEKTIAEAFEQFQKDSQAARHRRQDALKLKDAKDLAFGRYATRVPSFNLSRHFDYPLPCSFATYNCEKKQDFIKIAQTYIPGQHFFGAMVPRTYSQMKDFESELLHLKEVRSLVENCVRTISDSEDCALIKRLKAQTAAFEELSMPASVGYEVISLDGNREVGDEKAIQLLQKSPSTTLELDHEGCCTSPGGRSRLADCLKPEHSGEESSQHLEIHLTQSIEVPHVDKNRKLAVVPTRNDNLPPAILKNSSDKSLELLPSDVKESFEDGDDDSCEEGTGVEMVLGQGESKEEDSGWLDTMEYPCSRIGVASLD